MKENKFVYTLSALLMACIISFSGVGGLYIQASAKNDLVDALWNDNATAEENIAKYMRTFMNYIGAFAEPTLAGEIYAGVVSGEFAAWMLTEGYTEEIVEEVCHGGGGFVRDGISVDDDGNVTYSDEVSDLFHGYICEYLDSGTGYVLFKTLKTNEIDPTLFSSKDVIDNLAATVDSFGLVWVYVESSGNGKLVYTPTENFYDMNAKDMHVVYASANEYMAYGSNDLLNPYVIEDDWSYHLGYRLCTAAEYSSSSASLNFKESSYGLSSLFITSSKESFMSLYNYVYGGRFEGLVSSDGRTVKIWYNLDKFKQYSVNYQPYYVTQNWVNYDASQNNSITMSNQEYQYYTDNSSTIYNNIQNNIDNSVTNIGSNLTERDVQKIVDDAVKEILDSLKENEDSGNDGDDGGNGGSGDSGDDGGTGVVDLIEGIGKIFDTILSLIGKLMGVVADFTQSILDLFSGFTSFTDGFSNFLAGAFGFIPAEIWDVIQVGLSLMVLLAVIKFLRK